MTWTFVTVVLTTNGVPEAVSQMLIPDKDLTALVETF